MPLQLRLTVPQELINTAVQVTEYIWEGEEIVHVTLVASAFCIPSDTLIHCRMCSCHCPCCILYGLTHLCALIVSIASDAWQFVNCCTKALMFLRNMLLGNNFFFKEQNNFIHNQMFNLAVKCSISVFWFIEERCSCISLSVPVSYVRLIHIVTELQKCPVYVIGLLRSVK